MIRHCVQFVNFSLNETLGINGLIDLLHYVHTSVLLRKKIHTEVDIYRIVCKKKQQQQQQQQQKTKQTE